MGEAAESEDEQETREEITGLDHGRLVAILNQFEKELHWEDFLKILVFLFKE